jgi:hypothetical protein
METNKQTKGKSMNTQETINQLGYIVSIIWADGRRDTQTGYSEEFAIKQVEKLNSIHGVTAVAHKLTIGDQIA